MDLLRSVGGVLFAVGAVLVLVRKSGHHEWGDFVRLLVVLVPAATLYLLALGGSEGAGGERDARPWQSVLMVAAILLVPVVLARVPRLVGANTGHVLYGAGVFALTALFAGYAARRARVSYAALLAGLSLLLAWLLVWESPRPSIGQHLSLAAPLAAAVLLLVAAARLARAGAIGARRARHGRWGGGGAGGRVGRDHRLLRWRVFRLLRASRKPAKRSSSISGSGPIRGSGSIIRLGAAQGVGHRQGVGARSARACRQQGVSLDHQAG